MQFNFEGFDEKAMLCNMTKKKKNGGMFTEGSSKNKNIKTIIFLFPNNALKRTTALVATARNMLTGI